MAQSNEELKEAIVDAIGEGFKKHGGKGDGSSGTYEGPRRKRRGSIFGGGSSDAPSKEGGIYDPLAGVIRRSELPGSKKAADYLQRVGQKIGLVVKPISILNKALESLVLPGTREFFTGIQTQFGDLNEMTSATANVTTNNFRKSFNEIAETYSKRVGELDPELVIDVVGPGGEKVASELLPMIGMSLEDVQKEYFEFVTSFDDTLMTRLANDLQGTEAHFVRLSKGLGLSQDELSGFIERELSLTGKASLDQLKQLEKFSVAVADATGVPFKTIARGAAKIRADVEKFGNVTVEEAARIAGALSKAGVAFEQFSSMVGQFQGFESAAGAVSDLTSVFGVHLDTMDLMMKANEDQEAFMHTIRDSFLDQGVAIEDLNHSQKRLLASTLGMDVSSAERFFREGFLPDPEDLEEATDSASAEEALQRINDSFADLVEQTGDFEQAMSTVVEDQILAKVQSSALDASTKLAGAAAEYRKVVRDMNETALDLAGLGPDDVNFYKNVIDTTSKEDIANALKPLTDPVNNTFQSAVGVAGESLGQHLRDQELISQATYDAYLENFNRRMTLINAQYEGNYGNLTADMVNNPDAYKTDFQKLQDERDKLRAELADSKLKFDQNLANAKASGSGPIVATLEAVAKTLKEQLKQNSGQNDMFEDLTERLEEVSKNIQTAVTNSSKPTVMQPVHINLGSTQLQKVLMNSNPPVGGGGTAGNNPTE